MSGLGWRDVADPDTRREVLARLPLAEQVRLSQLPPPEARQRIREAAGVTKAEVARELGVSPAAVHNWEHGARQPRRGMAIAYRLVLDELQTVAAPAGGAR